MFEAVNSEAINRLMNQAGAILQMLWQVLLGVVWSNEAHLLFGRFAAYSLIATGLLLLAPVVPSKTIEICKCYCLKKWLHAKAYMARFKALFVPASVAAGVVHMFYAPY